MMDKHSSASYVSSGLFSLLGAMTLQDWALTVGIIFTILTFAVNTYFKKESLKIQKKQAEDGLDTPTN